jgi:hypothetical protein
LRNFPGKDESNFCHAKYIRSLHVCTLTACVPLFIGLKETSEAFFLACGTALLVCHTSASFGMLLQEIKFLSAGSNQFLVTSNQFILMKKIDPSDRSYWDL